MDGKTKECDVYILIVHSFQRQTKNYIGTLLTY